MRTSEKRYERKKTYVHGKYILERKETGKKEDIMQMEKKIGNKEDFQKDENEQGKNFKKERKKEKIMYVHSTVQGKEIGGGKN